MGTYRDTVLHINLSAISNNLERVKELVGSDTKIMGVVKASCYGLGTKSILQTMINKGVSYFAVAVVHEGIELRHQGINIPILLLSPASANNIEQIIEYNLMPSISNLKFLERLNNYLVRNNKHCKVHIKVETGMNRTGFKKEEAIEVAKLINDTMPNIKIEGIFSHLAFSGDRDYSKFQINNFREILAEIKKLNIDIPLTHITASGGITNYYPGLEFNVVRAGIMMYGYHHDDESKTKIELEPCVTLTSKIAFIKDVPAHTKIGYDCTFETTVPSKIATIPFGYADGYRRSLSNKGYVMINNQKAYIVGKVCMDMFMVDVTNIPNVALHDEVTIIDNKNITLDQIAEWCDTSVYEILCGLNPRIPRVYTC